MLTFPKCLNMMRVPQVAPSFFDAPGAQGSSNTAPSSAPAPQLSDDQLPNITFAFASEVGYKVSHACSMYIASGSATRRVLEMHWECIGVHGNALGVHWGCIGVLKVHHKCSCAIRVRVFSDAILWCKAHRKAVE